MKNLFHLFALCLLIVLSSCQKEVIPEPNEEPVVLNGPSLFITGNFNGINETWTIDGSEYNAESSFHVDPQDSVGFWYFDVLQNDTSFFPKFIFEIINHEQSLEVDFLDLVASTNSPSLNYLDGLTSYALQPSHFSVVYSPTPNDHYGSFIPVNTGSLNILSATDTIVDNKQFRLIEVSGDFMMTSFDNQSDILIDNFHARLAFSL
jgi:hypothetical protein